ncbi:MAG: DUF2147 domain-containing protein, partial [Gammaproteobacteria bacterium]|nr:DUF2147 domain-containing protein [Gammaproteobacteria bacterium]
MRKISGTLALMFVLSSIAAPVSFAATPIGLWVTVDDKTGARRSQV